ncbi:Lipoamide acyltransferase component of branched-chain alpha-keto acid dehydrogenase complex, mitochondrial [Fusarium oxysporum f. sp. cubense race 1]|uniref:Dihydrolipoamide acetyltransferase component of pyruvate dehydrogenase complex n=1 Tax=Fusarium oxysporum f. sp. cubense (strain race 1) TaxID=1229664 RepID=N4TTB3_FUSC1|nr:Lipoamide acyltransferase component of branched-chain alpha-keto acid dehydrogenase complex, mitochondrial [Fusarium oxysporum f. sp. cubense race 1]
MFLQRGSRVLQKQWHVARGMGSMAMGSRAPMMAKTQRWFSESRRLMAIKPVVLADIGEGIVECEVIQWFVEPGARVEEFSPLCEVQSDKASVEITSRFSGVVKKLHYEAGEMAKVGKPFVDIDIEGEAKAEDVDALSNQQADKEDVPPPPPTETQAGTEQQANLEAPVETPVKEKGKCASIATPAVRHLSKELNVNIADVDGTGRDGRVLKEDIYRFIKERDAKDSAQQVSPTAASSKPQDTSVQAETVVPLSNTQLQMFKTMTRSLTIPHFLYADEVDFSSLVELRKRLNRVIAKGPTVEGQPSKLSYLPFIIKAVSLALNQYPMLNARVDVDPKTNKPCLVHRSQHNIGIAMDTTGGLVVPVIKNVASLNILSIAAELSRLQALASQVSNIGNVGGTYVSPVIVEREVAILGIGRMRTVPAFDENDNVVKKQVTNFSWSADHRVIDGATMARAAEVVRQIVEEPDLMVMHLK